MKKRKVLITGSSKGLGKCLALTYASAGDDVILHGRNISSMETMKKHSEMLSNESKIQIIGGDITGSLTIQRLRDAAFNLDIDILINNAGVYKSGLVSEMMMIDILTMIDINLIAPIELTKAIYPLFERKKSGLIININSSAGKVPHSPEAVYCASKHGLRGFMNSFKFEAAQNNVKVLDVYLGGMKTDMTINRDFRNKLMDPVDVARVICDLSKDYESLRISEIDIVRSTY